MTGPSGPADGREESPLVRTGIGRGPRGDGDRGDRGDSPGFLTDLVYRYDPQPEQHEPWSNVKVGDPVYDLQGNVIGRVTGIQEPEDLPEFTIAFGVAADDPGALDPRWEWTEIRTLGSPTPRYAKGHCRHLEAVPVRTPAAELVAHLCLTCDTQLPAEWKP